MTSPHWLSVKLPLLALLLALSLSAAGVSAPEAAAQAPSSDPDIGPNTVEVFPYQDGGYRFMMIPLDTAPPFTRYSGISSPTDQSERGRSIY